MIQMQDFTAPLVEAKTKRKEICLKPSVAVAIKLAARAVGMDESTFISSAAYRKAQEVEASQYVTTLPNESFAAFAAAVDLPGKENEALAKIIAGSRIFFADA
jgi:uncharacterized protein (DUF1778 family)